MSFEQVRQGTPKTKRGATYFYLAVSTSRSSKLRASEWSFPISRCAGATCGDTRVKSADVIWSPRISLLLILRLRGLRIQSRKQILEVLAIAEAGEVGIVFDAVEVLPSGGDGLRQPGHRLVGIFIGEADEIVALRFQLH